MIAMAEVIKSLPLKRKVWVTFDNGEKYHVEIVCPMNALIVKQMLEERYLKEKGKAAKATRVVVF